jgi:hypothetical protein
MVGNEYSIDFEKVFNFRVCDHNYDCGGNDRSDETTDCGK